MRTSVSSEQGLCSLPSDTALLRWRCESHGDPWRGSTGVTPRAGAADLPLGAVGPKSHPSFPSPPTLEDIQTRWAQASAASFLGPPCPGPSPLGHNDSCRLGPELFSSSVPSGR